MSDTEIKKPESIKVLPAGDHRLHWRMIATTIQAGAAWLGGVAVFLYTNPTLLPLGAPGRVGEIAFGIFTIGKTIEAWQKNKDRKRTKVVVPVEKDTDV